MKYDFLKRFGKYIVYDNGDIMNINSYKFIKPTLNKDGYLFVSLTDDNKKVHRLKLSRVVYAAMNQKDIDECGDIHHKDHNKDNNHISNLVELSKVEHYALHTIPKLEETILKLEKVISEEKGKLSKLEELLTSKKELLETYKKRVGN